MQTEQQLAAIRMGSEMSQGDLPPQFIVQCVRAAMEHEGVLDLMALWFEAENDTERAEVVSDLPETP